MGNLRCEMRVIATLLLMVSATTVILGTVGAQEAHRECVDVGVGDSFHFAWKSRYYSDRYDWNVIITAIDLVGSDYVVSYSCSGDSHCDDFLAASATVPLVPVDTINTGEAVLFINKQQVKEVGSGDTYIKYDDRGVLLEYNDVYGRVFLVIPSILGDFPPWLLVVIISVSVIVLAFIIEKVRATSKTPRIMKVLEEHWGQPSTQVTGALSNGRWLPGEPET